MLSDTIKEVNKAEQQAQDIVQEAKDKAASIIESAKETAKQKFADAEKAAKDSAKAALNQAIAAGEKEKENYASELNTQLEQESQQALARADVAVDTIVNSLL